MDQPVQTQPKKLWRGMLPAFAILLGLALGVLARAPARQAMPDRTTAGTQAPYQYLLRAGEEQLDVFLLRDDAGAPRWEHVAGFDVDFGEMTERDRQYLQRGLALRDAAELQRALEDYLPS